MKSFLIVSIVGVLLTGCASPKSPSEIGSDARKVCTSAGFNVGSPQYSECFVNVLNNSNKPSFLQQYMLHRAANPSY